ncbi:MAG: hypothetical protein OXH76_11335 [Boseongicola sp.]|nr:hypothetical protein [Boseongicola sp.]
MNAKATASVAASLATPWIAADARDRARVTGSPMPLPCVLMIARIEGLVCELNRSSWAATFTRLMQLVARARQEPARFDPGGSVEFGETGKMFADPECSRTGSRVTGRIGQES